MQVENQSGEVMPFSLGYHPGFACPFDAAHGTQDYVLRFAVPQTPAVVAVSYTHLDVYKRQRLWYTVR